MALDDDTRRQVRDSDCGFGAVDVLPARAAGAVSVDSQVGGIDCDVDILGFGHNGDGYRAGMNSASALCDGDALDAVSAALVFEFAEGSRAVNRENNFLEAADCRGICVDNVNVPTLPLGVARVHPEQLARKECRLLAADAAA